MAEKSPSQLQNENFLRQGGIYQSAAQKAAEAAKPGYQEYPKMVYVSKGVQEIEHFAEDIRGKDRSWTERKELFEQHIVENEDEERRVLGGGKSNAQAASDREQLIFLAEQSGVRVDRRWSDERIRAEMAKVA